MAPKNLVHITTDEISAGIKYHVTILEREQIRFIMENFAPSSGNWDSTYTTVAAQSASWNERIPLSGSDQISGSLIPFDTDTYSLGTSSTLWKDVYTSNWHYFGDPSVDGSWRQGVESNNFITQRRESGAWVTKHTITP